MTRTDLGLAIATAMSVANVLRDVTTKRLLKENNIFPVLFWIRTLGVIVFAYILFRGTLPHPLIRGSAPLFGFQGFTSAPHIVFSVYLFLDLLAVCLSAIFYSRALQLAPLSLCVPFLSFTPIFLLGTSALFLHEVPTWSKACGALLVVAGSLLMNVELFAQGVMAPVLAIVKNAGTRYSLLTALLFAISNPLDKKLILMSSSNFQAFCYGVGLFVFFGAYVAARRVDCITILRTSLLTLLAASILDCGAMLLQFLSYRYLEVLLVIGIKRAGIVLAVLMGWLFFKEHHIRRRLFASSVMFIGVLIMYTVADLRVSAAMAVCTLGVAVVVGWMSLRTEVAATK